MSPLLRRPIAPVVAVAGTAALCAAGTPALAHTTAPHETVSVSDAGELHDALENAAPGETIELADGVYEGYFSAATAGRDGARITLTGSSDAELVSPGGGYVLHLDGASHWDVEGLTLRGGQKGIVLDAADHVVIDGVTVHDLDMEAVHFRSSSAHGTIRDSKIHDTGQNMRGMGEGVYVGSSRDLSDRSDHILIENNTIGPDVRGEAVDIKEGTTGGWIVGNTFDGTGLTDNNHDDSWVDVKGNDWLVEGNTGTHTINDGYQVSTIIDGWGCGNTFRDNDSDLTGADGDSQYAIHVKNHDPDECPVTVSDTNTVTGGNGLTNPGIPVGD